MGKSNRAGWGVLAAAVAALILSFAVYYRHFTTELWNQWSGLFSRLTGSGKTGAPGSVDTTQSAGLLDFFARRGVWLGPSVVLGALAGLLPLRAIGANVRALLFAWLGAGLVFALLDRALGDTVRWYYLAGAPLALLAGRFFGSLALRTRPGRVLSGLVLSVILFQTLVFWIGELIFTRYH